MLKGSYALAVIFDGKENIYGVKKDAPLLLGIGEDEYFLSSDISAILEHTKEHIVIEDNEIVEISEDYKIYYEGILLNKDIQTATWNIEEAQKNGYNHFMLKEIEEQEELSKKLYAKYIEEDNFSDSVVDLTKYKKVDLVGCGSAYHASLIAKYFADKYISTSKLNVNCYVASEYRYQNHYYDEPTLVILFSQSDKNMVSRSWRTECSVPLLYFYLDSVICVSWLYPSQCGVCFHQFLFRVDLAQEGSFGWF